MPETFSRNRAGFGFLRDCFFLAVLLLLSVGPIISILALSFDVSARGEPYQFGFDAWARLFEDAKSLDAAWTSLLLTIRVPLGLAIALVMAWLLVRVQVPGAALFETVFWFAYFLPLLPMVTSWNLLLDGPQGVLNQVIHAFGGPRAFFDMNSYGGIIWAHMTIQTVPILVILILPTMRLIDRSFEDAANLSGAHPLKTLRRVILPLALPAALVGAVASFLKALESFEVEQILGVQARIDVFSTRIYSFITEQPPMLSEAMALSSLFLILLVALASVVHLVQRRLAVPTGAENETHRTVSSYSASSKRIGAFVVGGYLFLTVGLPLIMLAMGSFMKLFGFFDLSQPWTVRHWETVLGSGDVQRSMLSTLGLGLSTAFLATLLFAAIAWTIMHLPERIRGVMAVATWLPWAFPSVVLGAGILQLSLMPGLSVMHGTIVPLILAMMIKEIPIGVHLLNVSMGQTHRETLEAAQLTKASPATIFRRIVLPLNLPALILVFMLVFAATIRDVGTLILIAPPDLQTLSILIFKYASLGEFEAASVLGTLLAILCVLVSLVTHYVATMNRRLR
ncbi:ABC transporter permease [Actibacterium pelagium]|uniref:ABC transporter permease n=1 Tax=Actibacterium pelagium TaxID=2029103 RepID=A0A917AKK5_9RHOB|nr:iron ABC transporter permease [Actibacterium pelagium]GGE59113.1 ABC transporter permease [Actibacterium pelagium]